MLWSVKSKPAVGRVVDTGDDEMLPEDLALAIAVLIGQRISVFAEARSLV